MSCNPISSNNPWSAADKGVASSTIVLTVSAIALALILHLANPLVNQQHMPFVYAAASLGGLAALGLVISIALKYCKTNTNIPEAPTSQQKQESLINVQNHTLVFDEERLRQTVLEEWDDIQNNTRPDRIIKHRGKHMKVFEHVDFPGLIIKLPSPKHAQDMLKCVTTSQQVLKDYPEITSCKIPATKVIQLGDIHSLFVMEKVQGINFDRAQEVSEQAYEQFSNDPAVEKQWRTYFRDATELICLIGYWDTSWNNIILTDKGLGFVDFENVYPEPQNIITGISRLLMMAPPQFADMIVQIAAKYNITSEELCEAFTGYFGNATITSIEEFKLHRQAELDLRSQVRKWHQDHKSIDAGAIDATRWNIGSIERAIVDKFNQGIKDRFTQYKDNPVEQRKVHWQPLSYALQVKRSEFDAALENLHKQGIVCTWTTQEMLQAELAVYNIYF